MTKFDHEKNLPYIFAKNNLTILPVKRGTYVIGKFDIYKEIYLDYDKIEPIEVDFPEWIQSINPKNIYSEDSAIKCAYVSGMINDLMGEKGFVFPSVGGRMSTSFFDFQVQSRIKDKFYNISVENSQCQIDAGYETRDKLMLIEAKNSFSEDFLVRQIYYPYRLWRKKIDKEIIPVFMIYANDMFSFFVYEFRELNVYNSLELVEQINYIIKDKVITLDEIKRISNNVHIKSEPDCPFPQANSFFRILDLLKSLVNNPLNMSEISTMYDFDKRQAQYYSRAGIYLGLIESIINGKVQLSQLGEKIMAKRKRERNLRIVKCILEYRIFYEAFNLYLDKGFPPSKAELLKIMEANIGMKYKNTTIKRRSSTVLNWIEWILGLFK